MEISVKGDDDAILLVSQTDEGFVISVGESHLANMNRVYLVQTK